MMCDVKTCTSLGVVFMLNYQYQYDCCGQMFFRLRFDDYWTNGTKTWSLVQSDREIQCSNHVCGLWYRNLWLLLYVHIMYVGYGTEICGYCYMFTSCTLVSTKIHRSEIF